MIKMESWEYLPPFSSTALQFNHCEIMLKSVDTFAEKAEDDVTGANTRGEADDGPEFGDEPASVSEPKKRRRGRPKKIKGYFNLFKYFYGLWRICCIEIT